MYGGEENASCGAWTKARKAGGIRNTQLSSWLNGFLTAFNAFTFGDGDVAMAVAPSMLNNAVDVYVGIGGSPEAVIAASAIKCLGGQMLVKMWPRDHEELETLQTAGWGEKLNRIYDCDDLASGDEIMFAATGISD